MSEEDKLLRMFLLMLKDELNDITSFISLSGAGGKQDAEKLKFTVIKQAIYERYAAEMLIRIFKMKKGQEDWSGFVLIN